MIVEKLTPEQQKQQNIEKMWLFEMASLASPAERVAAVTLLQNVHHLSMTQIWSQIEGSYLPKRLEEMQDSLAQLLAKNDVLESQSLKIAALESELQTWRKSFLFRVWNFCRR
jgi:hypothetical protein